MKVLIGVNEIEQLLSYKNSYTIFEFTNYLYNTKNYNPKEISSDLSISLKSVYSYKHKLDKIATIDNEHYIQIDLNKQYPRKSYLSLLLSYIYTKIGIEKNDGDWINADADALLLRNKEFGIFISDRYLKKFLNCSTSKAINLIEEAERNGLIEGLNKSYSEFFSFRHQIILLHSFKIIHSVEKQKTFFNNKV